MFFFNSKKGVQSHSINIRDEWGVLRKEMVSRQDTPRLSDQELADALQVGLITVLTHRKDNE